MKILIAYIICMLAICSGCKKETYACIDLSRARQSNLHHYVSSTDYQMFAPDGSITATQNLTMTVEVRLDDAGRQFLKCMNFKVTTADGTTQSIPALAGWTHELDVKSTSEVLGIKHSDFNALKYENGNNLPPEMSYLVYNTFVDFYAFNNVFAENAPDEPNRSIGALRTPGQTIEHYSAGSKVPVNMGDAVKEGSYFQNGKATLTLKGRSEIKGRDSALVGFDSGDSSFMMLMEPMPGMTLRVKGGSHYFGDLYIDATSLWLQKATFIELVLTEMRFADNPPQASVAVRKGSITSVE